MLKTGSVQRAASYSSSYYHVLLESRQSQAEKLSGSVEWHAVYFCRADKHLKSGISPRVLPCPCLWMYIRVYVCVYIYICMCVCVRVAHWDSFIIALSQLYNQNVGNSHDRIGKWSGLRF